MAGTVFIYRYKLLSAGGDAQGEMEALKGRWRGSRGDGHTQGEMETLKGGWRLLHTSRDSPVQTELTAHSCSSALGQTGTTSLISAPSARAHPSTAMEGLTGIHVSPAGVERGRRRGRERPGFHPFSCCCLLVGWRSRGGRAIVLLVPLPLRAGGFAVHGELHRKGQRGRESRVKPSQKPR